METTKIKSENTFKVSKLFAISFFIWILAVDILFYSESFGLNALIAAGITIPLFGWLKPMNLEKAKWWAAALIWLLSSFGVFINGTAVPILCFYLGFFYFCAVNSNTKLSMPVGLFQSMIAFAMGIFNFFNFIGSIFKKKENRKNKWVINFLLITIPLIIIIVFLKLYQAADKDFYELTKFINLDFISWGFIFTYLFLTLFLFGFFFFQDSKAAEDFEDNLQDEIPPTYQDKIQEFFGLKNEIKIGLILLVTLNAMLVLYNGLDVKFILNDMHDPTSDTTLSEVVHAGIYALIFSIVLVILIITYLLRGQLNFQGNKLIKPLILFWLLQNLFMVATTAIKNYEYIHFWGLTYKRIGVFIYLFLAVIGLLITLYKVIKKRSFWFLVRRTSIAFSICLAALLTFNWNRAIADYNTAFVAAERIDFEYLYSLGEDTYPSILSHQAKYGGVDDWVIEEIVLDLPLLISRKSEESMLKDWKSLVWSEYVLQEELKKFKIQ